MKKGAAKLFLPSYSKTGNIIRREGAPEAAATVTGFVQVDKNFAMGAAKLVCSSSNSCV